MKQIWDVTSASTEGAVSDTLKSKLKAEEGEYGDDFVAVPFIQLYDDDVAPLLHNRC